MKKFIIKIGYSWSDEEEPIKMNAADKWGPFNHMCNLAIKEYQIECQEHPEYANETVIKIFENKIIVHYGHDDEECYYELEEI